MIINLKNDEMDLISSVILGKNHTADDVITIRHNKYPKLNTAYSLYMTILHVTSVIFSEMDDTTEMLKALISVTS